MAKEKSGINFEVVIDAVEHEGMTARTYMQHLRGKVQDTRSDVAKATLSSDSYRQYTGTEFSTVDELVESFESYREGQGDESFECGDSSKIDAAAKSQILDAKISVLVTLGHIPADEDSKHFARTLKREMTYGDVKKVNPPDLSELWQKFAEATSLRRAHRAAEKSGHFPLLPDDADQIAEQQADLAAARRVAERLESDLRYLQRQACSRAQADKENKLSIMDAKAEEAEEAFKDYLSLV